MKVSYNNMFLWLLGNGGVYEENASIFADKDSGKIFAATANETVALEHSPYCSEVGRHYLDNSELFTSIPVGSDEILDCLIDEVITSGIVEAATDFSLEESAIKGHSVLRRHNRDKAFIIVNNSKYVFYSSIAGETIYDFICRLVDQNAANSSTFYGGEMFNTIKEYLLKQEGRSIVFFGYDGHALKVGIADLGLSISVQRVGTKDTYMFLSGSYMCYEGIWTELWRLYYCLHFNEGDLSRLRFEDNFTWKLATLWKLDSGVTYDPTSKEFMKAYQKSKVVYDNSIDSVKMFDYLFEVLYGDGCDLYCFKAEGEGVDVIGWVDNGINYLFKDSMGVFYFSDVNTMSIPKRLSSVMSYIMRKHAAKYRESLRELEEYLKSERNITVSIMLGDYEDTGKLTYDSEYSVQVVGPDYLVDVCEDETVPSGALLLLIKALAFVYLNNDTMEFIFDSTESLSDEVVDLTSAALMYFEKFPQRTIPDVVKEFCRLIEVNECITPKELAAFFATLISKE